jgi:hypothetical protein
MEFRGREGRPRDEEDKMGADFVVTVGFHDEGKDDVAVVVAATSREAAEEKAFLYFMESGIEFASAATKEEFESDNGQLTEGMFVRVS